jgi:hypothetical protein
MRETHGVSHGVAPIRQGRPSRLHAAGAGLARLRLVAPKATPAPIPGIFASLGVGAFGGAPAEAQSSVTFRGIYEFAGGNTKADATDPNLAGVVLTYYWSQIEPQKGVFDWSPIESAMAPWIAAHKKIVLRISTSGGPSWDPPYSGSGTPAWVYADGARSITDNGETIPVYWDPAYLSDYQSFVAAFAGEFDGNPNLAFIEPGVGMGGETLPETGASPAGITAWEADGYTDAVWLSTVETISSFVKASFQTTRSYWMVDRTFFDGSGTYFNAVMAWFKTVPHWHLQNNGLTSTQTLSAQWSGPLALEQLTSTENSGDCLCADISNGLDNLDATFLMIYKTDVDNPANAAYLAAAESTATP